MSVFRMYFTILPTLDYGREFGIQASCRKKKTFQEFILPLSATWLFNIKQTVCRETCHKLDENGSTSLFTKPDHGRTSVKHVCLNVDSWSKFSYNGATSHKTKPIHCKRLKSGIKLNTAKLPESNLVCTEQIVRLNVFTNSLQPG